jgi:hypothetical protein
LQGNLNTEAEKLRKQAKNAADRAEKAENARDELERELALLAAENKV